MIANAYDPPLHALDPLNDRMRHVTAGDDQNAPVVTKRHPHSTCTANRPSAPTLHPRSAKRCGEDSFRPNDTVRSVWLLMMATLCLVLLLVQLYVLSIISRIMGRMMVSRADLEPICTSTLQYVESQAKRMTTLSLQIFLGAVTKTKEVLLLPFRMACHLSRIAVSIENGLENSKHSFCLSLSTENACGLGQRSSLVSPSNLECEVPGSLDPALSHSYTSVNGHPALVKSNSHPETRNVDDCEPKHTHLLDHNGESPCRSAYPCIKSSIQIMPDPIFPLEEIFATIDQNSSSGDEKKENMPVIDDETIAVPPFMDGNDNHQSILQPDASRGSQVAICDVKDSIPPGSEDLNTYTANKCPVFDRRQARSRLPKKVVFATGTKQTSSDQRCA